MFKKAMSPIIATVLLIAFAVSLGVVIMNISVNVSITGCADVEISILRVGSDPRICFDSQTNTIQYTIVNERNPISGFRIGAIGVGTEEKTISERINTQSNFVGTFALSDPRNARTITITPQITEGLEPRYCSDKRLVIEQIPLC